MKKIASMNKREVLSTLNKLANLQNKLLAKLAQSATLTVSPSRLGVNEDPEPISTVQKGEGYDTSYKSNFAYSTRMVDNILDELEQMGTQLDMIYGCAYPSIYKVQDNDLRKYDPKLYNDVMNFRHKIENDEILRTFYQLHLSSANRLTGLFGRFIGRHRKSKGSKELDNLKFDFKSETGVDCDQFIRMAGEIKDLYDQINYMQTGAPEKANLNERIKQFQQKLFKGNVNRSGKM